ncbi:MAG TPA: aldo/keto reductase [Vicinamibacterales bacterium]|nr:aldo/keto reductase [Vicinamibacterales bacterium]
MPLPTTPPFPTRSLGREGLAVSALGLGCMGMSDFYGPSDDQRSIRVIHHALEIGINFFDTADIYGVGRNESLVGLALSDRRKKAVIATKFGNIRRPDGSFVGISGRPEYVISACDASLRRLGIETIDLYYQHRVDPDVPIEETVGAMASLVAAGKVRHLGLSEASVATLRRACAVHPIAALQSEYSLWTRDPDDGVLQACAELGVAFVAYSPLGRGFLTGKIRSADALDVTDWRRKNPRFEDANLAKNLALVDGVEALARARRVSAAQIALAWVLSRGPHVIAIPGTRSIPRLDENAAAARLTLSDADLRALDEIAPAGAAAGDRYAAGGMASLNR